MVATTLALGTTNSFRAGSFRAGDGRPLIRPMILVNARYVCQRSSAGAALRRSRPMSRVYGYDQAIGDFREFAAEDEWRKQILRRGSSATYESISEHR